MEVIALTKRVSVYFLITLILKGVGFLLLPLYTKHLDVADYGVLAIIDIIGLYFGILVSGGLGTALVRFFDKNDVINNNITFTTINIIVLSLFLFLFLFAYIFLQSFSFIEVNPEYVLLALIFVGVDALNSIYIRQLALKKEDAKYFYTCITRVIIAVPLNIYFIAYIDLGILGFLYANIISSIALLVLYSLPHQLKVFALPSKEQVKKITVYAFPFIPNGLLEALFTSISIIMLTYYTDAELVGLFAIAVKLSTILLLTSEPIQNIWVPHMFSIRQENNKAEVYGQGFRLILLALYGVSALLIAGSGILYYFLIDAKFASSMAALPILLIANCIYMMRGTARIGLAINDDVKRIPMLTLASIALALPFYIVLVQELGIVGAALGQLLMSCILVALLVSSAKKYISLPVNYLLLSIPALVLIMLPYALGLEMGVDIILSLSVIGAFVIVAWFGGILTKNEKQKLTKLISRS